MPRDDQGAEDEAVLVRVPALRERDLDALEVGLLRLREQQLEDLWRALRAAASVVHRMH